MRIGILTQPLHNNYGGLLQNFALQKVMIELGHEVFTINIDYKKQSLLRRSASLLKRLFLKLSGKNIRVFNIKPTLQETKIISQYTTSFIKRNINTTKLLNQKVNQESLKEYDFEAYIVGSDQVWRPRYSPQQSTFFLDFLEENNKIVKISYAASFGVSELEFNVKQTAYFGKLLRLFNAVSVREDTAVGLCKKHFDVEALHHLDPTMLLDKEVYTTIVKKENVDPSPGNLFTYILDKSTMKTNVVECISNKFKFKEFSVMPIRSFTEPGKRNINDCVFPPVEKWLRGFIDAEFVVTDSFHGTVFAILFNKPFISIANKDRGLTRFTSLLRLFQLEDRLVIPSKKIDFDNIKDINWEKTNNILILEKEKSIKYLRNNLT